MNKLFVFKSILKFNLYQMAKELTINALPFVNKIDNINLYHFVHQDKAYEYQLICNQIRNTSQLNHH